MAIQYRDAAVQTMQTGIVHCDDGDLLSYCVIILDPSQSQHLSSLSSIFVSRVSLLYHRSQMLLSACNAIQQVLPTYWTTAQRYHNA